MNAKTSAETDESIANNSNESANKGKNSRTDKLKNKTIYNLHQCSECGLLFGTENEVKAHIIIKNQIKKL